MKKDETKYMISMLESCFTYGGIGVYGYNYNKYILPYKDILGEKTFNKVYNKFLKDSENYEIQESVYTDSEGSTYNSLIKK